MPTDTELTTKDVFTYSPQDRLLTQTHQINGGAIEVIASNTYDELGQLISKKVGNTTTLPTQKIDYTYNIRGWLTAINNTAALQQGTDLKDLFAFKINYNTTTSGISGVNALYNGNIAETQWATNSDNGVLRTYGYKYDNLNRLKAGIYKKGTVLDMYNESLTYDKNGNIMGLTRNGNSETALQQIDNLVYSYGPANNLNQLTKVVDNATTYKAGGFVDSASNTVDDYGYDANGNMLTDANKNITAITYNHLNLPTKITFGSTGNIVYIYNAAGQKLGKIVTQGTTITSTLYLGGYQYLQPYLGSWALQFFPTAEGYVEPSGSSYTYVYQYKDHLGNIRLGYKNTGTTTSPVLQIAEENNYYPFGLKQMGYNGVKNGVENKYKYNGKELQDELGLNTYDYGARFYDPSTGRWYTVDAMAEKFSEMSPYNYALNNPVIYVDPDGNEVEMCCDGLKGLLVGLIDNVAGTNIRSKYGGTDFNTGTKVADIVSVIGGSILTGQGMADMTGGAAGLDASVTATAGSGGLAIEVSGPAAVISTGLIAKGALEVTVGSTIVSNAMSNLNESGKIYKVPGTDTKSGEPYIGRTQQSSPKKRGGENAKDGRNRTNAEVIDTYDPSKKGQGAYKEQKAINKNGGVKSLDNKRNEASPERMKELKKKYGNGK